MEILLPILIFILGATVVAVGMLVAGGSLGPSRQSAVKQMPYESGMDPVHSARRRFDVRFYLVAIAFLVFDVELLYLYPWAVASGALGTEQQVRQLGLVGYDSQLVFGEIMVFIALLAVALAYAWRKGVFQWR